MLNNCSDQSYMLSFITTLSLGIVDIAYVALSWMPFLNYYENINHWNYGTGPYAYDCSKPEEDLYSNSTVCNSTITNSTVGNSTESSNSTIIANCTLPTNSTKADGKYANGTNIFLLF
jgi:hypothetical protein